jgi:hypothetical protein
MTNSSIGLLFDILGTWLIAYEVLRGYPLRNRAEIASIQLNNLESHVDRMVASIREFPEDVYSLAEKR